MRKSLLWLCITIGTVACNNQPAPGPNLPNPSGEPKDTPVVISKVHPELKIDASTRDALMENFKNHKKDDGYRATLSVADLKELMAMQSLKDCDSLVLYFGAYRKKSLLHNELEAGDYARSKIKNPGMDRNLEKALVKTPTVLIAFKQLGSCDSTSEKFKMYTYTASWDVFRICPPPTGACR